MSLSLANLHRVRGNIILLGESGVGKSYWAKKIHNDSIRSAEPYYALNMATLSETLVESELFGHIRGAFTGAHCAKKGFCELVRGGILFLDEISELSLGTQKKLLGLLEERCFYPVGSTVLKQFKGQIIAATNKNLEELVRQKKFREDLYYRLTVFPIKVPSLCERSTDEIHDLVNYFLDEISIRYSREGFALSDELVSFLVKYSWPGNIRQLKNCIEYLVGCTENELASLNDLPPWINLSGGFKLKKNYHQALAEFEKSYISNVLEINSGKINQTARMVQISKSTLISKMKKYGIDSQSNTVLSIAG